MRKENWNELTFNGKKKRIDAVLETSCLFSWKVFGKDNQKAFIWKSINAKTDTDCDFLRDEISRCYLSHLKGLDLSDEVKDRVKQKLFKKFKIKEGEFDE